MAGVIKCFDYFAIPMVLQKVKTYNILSILISLIASDPQFLNTSLILQAFPSFLLFRIQRRTFNLQNQSTPFVEMRIKLQNIIGI